MAYDSRERGHHGRGKHGSRQTEQEAVRSGLPHLNEEETERDCGDKGISLATLFLEQSIIPTGATIFPNSTSF